MKEAQLAQYGVILVSSALHSSTGVYYSHYRCSGLLLLSKARIDLQESKAVVTAKATLKGSVVPLTKLAIKVHFYSSTFRSVSPFPLS